MEKSEIAYLKIMAWFFDNPTRRIHFNELCRSLKLSAPTVKAYCDEFMERNWIKEERTANLRIFFLNNESFVVKAMKKAYFLEKIRKAGIENIADENIISIAIYGSYASGEYDEKSDLDILVIGRKEQGDYSVAMRLEKALKLQIQVNVVSLDKWENAKKEPFGKSVLKNHVVIRGSAL